jgi:hypothetical protein
VTYNESANTYTDTTTDSSLGSSSYCYSENRSGGRFFTRDGDNDGNNDGLISIGESNVVIGWNAGEVSSGHYANVLIGAYAGQHMSLDPEPTESHNANSNTCIGGNACKQVTTGNDMTCIGANACASLTNVPTSAAFGSGALTNLTSGNGKNVAIGNFAGAGLINGVGNVFLGHNAGRALTQPLAGSISGNIIIGTDACSLDTTGSGGLCDADNMSNILWIDGYNNDPPLIYGNFEYRTLSLNGLVSTGNESITLGAGDDKLNPTRGSLTVTADAGGNTIYGIKSVVPAGGTQLTLIYAGGGTLTIPDDPNCDDAGGPKSSYYPSIQLTADWIPNSANDTLTLISNGTCWVELSRSDN